MNVIFLCGPSHSGKTTTINMVYNDLLNSQATIITNYQHIAKGSKQDFFAVVNYCNKKIAFFSMGDYKNYVEFAIAFFIGQNCDVLICALNRRFKKPLTNRYLYQFTNTVVKKSVGTNHSTLNRKDAKAIISNI